MSLLPRTRLQHLLGLAGILFMAILLPGCSGGSGPLSVSSTTESSVPEGVPISSSLTLGGQQAAIVLQTQNGSVSGIVDVGAAPATPVRNPAAVVVSAGRYPFTGTLVGRHFEARGTFVAGLYSFLLRGDLPTSRRGGVMTLTGDVNGDGVQDVITTSPPLFPAVSKTSATAAIQFSDASGGFNGLSTTLDSARGLYQPSGSNALDAYLAATTDPGATKRFLKVQIVNTAAVASGQSYNAGNTGQAVVVVAYVEAVPTTSGLTIRRWYSNQGTVSIQSYGAQTLTLQFNNLAMQADATTGSTATGAFKLNGSFTVHGPGGGVTVG